MSSAREIGDCEKRIRQAEAAHADEKTLAALYRTLGILYQGVGNFPKSEAAAEREVGLFRHGSPQDQAGALSRLAAVHVEMKNMRQAEKERIQVLHLREKTGDTVALALAWNDLASLYVRSWRFDEALAYATKATAVLVDGASVDVHDRIAARQTMAYALCGAHRCQEAIPVLRSATELATSKLGSDSLDAGVAEYLLGYAYSQDGQTDLADRWMSDGISKMKPYRAHGRAPYLHAISQYAQFLRATGKTDKAAAVDRDIRVANSTVDAIALRE
jgi:tetratricopeptide (TPR) repeat protein